MAPCITGYLSAAGCVRRSTSSITNRKNVVRQSLTHVLLVFAQCIARLESLCATPELEFRLSRKNFLVVSWLSLAFVVTQLNLTLIIQSKQISSGGRELLMSRSRRDPTKWSDGLIHNMLKNWHISEIVDSIHSLLKSFRILLVINWFVYQLCSNAYYVCLFMSVI